jgi:hypothetical protein
MAGNEDELPDEGSTRLRDRAASQFRRRQGTDGSTRLEDQATNALQARRQQAERAREAVAERAGEFANALDLSPDRIEPIQLDDRGEEIGFVPDEIGTNVLAERFAADRPFVEPGDTLVDADPMEGVRTRTDPDAADEIADRAQQQFAADDQFAEPGDFGVDVGPGGVEDAQLTDTGARRRAGRQFTAETALRDVDPETDVRPAGDGFELTTPGQRRLRARQFEQQFDTFGTGELDPSTDIRATDGAFGLSRDPASEAAAADLDQQIPEVDIGPDDIELEQTADGGFEAIFEREVER